MGTYRPEEHADGRRTITVEPGNGRPQHTSAANNPFFNGPNANLLSLIPFAGLIMLLYLVSREIVMSPGRRYRSG